MTRHKLDAILAGIAMLCVAACNSGAPASLQTTKPNSPPPSESRGVESGNATTAEQAPPTAKADPAGQQSVRLRLAVDGEGLRLFNPTTTRATPIAFGRPQAEVLAMLERLRGSATKGVNKGCGAGPVDYAVWPDGLSVVFQRNRFVGWGMDRRAAGLVSTASGIGPGSNRGQLEAAYANVAARQSSLGTEFTVGGFSGLIDGTKAASKITDMWAGTSCVAR